MHFTQKTDPYSECRLLLFSVSKTRIKTDATPLARDLRTGSNHINAPPIIS